MTDSLFLKAPYRRFQEFIAQDADRFGLLRSVLEENGLPCEILDLAGKRHLILGPPGKASRGGLVFTAHYDRAADSPGANDNSAAVFMLVETAMEAAAKGADGPCFIFTDKEELSHGEGISDQGAYALALYLRKSISAGVPSLKVYCFDACGCGDTLIISTAADKLLEHEESSGAASLRRRVQQLRGKALEASRFIEKTLLLPTPFSDDAGFLKAGLAAQTITVLPAAEAASFVSAVRGGKVFAGALISSGAAFEGDRNLIPETWRVLNGSGDKAVRLTPKNWKSVVAFAKALSGIV